MLITVALSVEEYKELEKLARLRANMNSETLLRCFAGDLVHSIYTGGSDERMYAHQWLDRRFGDWWFAQELAEDRRAEKKAASQPSVKPSDEIPDYFDQLVAKKGGKS